MKFVKKFAKPVTLAQVKADTAMAQCKLVKESRLSVLPLTPTEHTWLAGHLG